MTYECSKVAVQSESERATLRIPLALNATMFVVGMAAGLWAQSSGLMADALDVLADASAYALALLAISRGAAFKRNAACWSGSPLLILGVGIVFDAVRRGLVGSEPLGLAMMAFSPASLVVNVTAMLVSGLLVWLTGLRAADLLVGLAIGLYVAREAVEILREAGQPPCATGTMTPR